eukprot:2167616-Alexandrium_andersonii.AAC.1
MPLVRPGGEGARACEKVVVLRVVGGNRRGWPSAGGRPPSTPFFRRAIRAEPQRVRAILEVTTPLGSVLQ